VIEDQARSGLDSLSPAEYKDILGQNGFKVANVKVIKHKV